MSTTTAVAASGMGAGYAVTVLTWALAQFHIVLPADVAVAMVALGTPAIHYVSTLVSAKFTPKA